MLNRVIKRTISNRVFIAVMVTVTALIGGLAIIATGKFDWRIQQIIANRRTGNLCESRENGDLSSFFSEDYSSARKRFVEAGRLAGAIMSRLVLTDPGPSGEELSVDIAWMGSPEPKRVLLHTSGLHGVEGFAGSAIQLKILQSKPVPPADSAFVLVHALNPYGMAWLRRFNESNVDLNRNFRFTASAWQLQSQIYNEINGFLNPKRNRLFDSFLLQAVGLMARYDYQILKQAIAGGQNQFPKGLFYTGKDLEQTPLLYGDWLEKHLSLVQYLFVIDVHTGLGSRCQEILAHKGTATDSSVLSDKLGKPLQQDFVREQEDHYQFSGGHNYLYRQVFPQTRVDFITEEFGTYPNICVLQALRDENRFHQYGDRRLNHPGKQRLKEAFNPDSPAWKTAVIQQGLSLYDRSKDLVFE